MAWGLEARVPFLDKEFLKVALDIKPEQKVFSKGSLQEKDQDGRPVMEKYVLRKAFDVAPQGERVSVSAAVLRSHSRSRKLTTHKCRSLQPYLPDEILWRQKEQFSDGGSF